MPTRSSKTVRFSEEYLNQLIEAFGEGISFFVNEGQEGKFERKEDKMPTYVYECSNGHVFEYLSKSSQDKPSQCPACGSSDLKRVPAAPSGFKFVGSGFYATDYKNSGKKE